MPLKKPLPDPELGKLPLASVQAWGLWRGSVIFERRGCRSYHRLASAYDLAPKAHLLDYQPKFAAAVAAWQQLSLASRHWYAVAASRRGLQMSGYNFFISRFLTNTLF